jgi:hypothetical protein
VNRDEAKIILQLYRPDTADAEDPQIAGALALAKRDPELARWLDEHCARQNALREKFRQLAAPAGLKEQIISEHAAFSKINSRRGKMVLVAALTVIVVSLAFLAPFWWPHRGGDDDKFSIYQNQMAGVALRGYSMDLTTNDPAQIRAYLAQQHAPADYVLPVPLQTTAMTGCAVENWRDKKVSMICFSTGKPLPPGQQSDLWLFVVDHNSVKDAPASNLPQFTKVNQLITAVWEQGGKLYFLGMAGDEPAIRKFL